ncbi:MAG: DUF3800 domain-containing protein [Chloroflexi bacterium]|nr:DUF3800 domain-containing protein [Chloroflexota bacterium]
MNGHLSAYAVFDESGDAGRMGRASRYLVVAGVVCDDLEPLRRAVRRTRRRMPKSLRGKAEVKAFETPSAARPVLESLTAIGVRIVAAIVDKRVFHLASPVDLVAQAYAACTAAALQHESGMIATIDRPFAQALQRDKVLSAMNDAADALGKRLTVIVDDSRHEKALQAADVVAWACFQKYERDAPIWWEVVQAQIIAEVMVS